MQKLIISLICCLLPTLALSDTLTISDNAPDRYVVVKGDTLWDISAKFFTDPWKWPEIWGLNKETIKNPHWIYPGDIVLLNRTAKTLNVEGAASAVPPSQPEGAAQAAPENENAAREQEYLGTERLSPRIRVVASEHNAIPSIPLSDIEPFLKRPLIIGKNELADAPVIVSGYEGRKLLSNDDIAYVKGLPTDQGLTWQVYRPGKALTDIGSDDVLGYEAVYLGDARVEKFGGISTLRIFGAKEEIYAGDRLTRVASGFPDNFVPRAPETAISAQIISIVNGISMAGQKSVVVINKGQHDDVQNGYVLALYRKGAIVKNPSSEELNKLPNMRYGLLFIFRTFEKVSYGLVMEAKQPIEMADIAQTP
jgi:hypothetical protein